MIVRIEIVQSFLQSCIRARVMDIPRGLCLMNCSNSIHICVSTWCNNVTTKALYKIRQIVKNNHNMSSLESSLWHNQSTANTSYRVTAFLPPTKPKMPLHVTPIPSPPSKAILCFVSKLAPKGDVAVSRHPLLNHLTPHPQR